MAEYIERDEFYNIEKLLDTDVVRKSKTASWLMEQFLHDIRAHPAADVALVGHGKWLMLPCQIGDIVYDCDFGMVNEWKIMGFSVGKVGLGVDAFGYSDDCEIVFYAEAVGHSAEMEFPQSSIGRDVFLVREQAEKELDV